MTNIKYKSEIKIGNSYPCSVQNYNSLRFRENFSRRWEEPNNVGTDIKSKYVKYERYVCYCRKAMTKVKVGWLWFNDMFSYMSAI